MLLAAALLAGGCGDDDAVSADAVDDRPSTTATGADHPSTTATDTDGPGTDGPDTEGTGGDGEPDPIDDLPDATTGESGPADVPTLQMAGTVDLDLAGGYCWSDGVGYFLWIGAGGAVNDIPQPEPYPQAIFRYYADMSRLGTTTDAGSVSWGLHGDDDMGGGSTFAIAADGLSGTFSLSDGNAGSYTCPQILTYDEVYGGS